MQVHTKWNSEALLVLLLSIWFRKLLSKQHMYPTACTNRGPLVTAVGWAQLGVFFAISNLKGSRKFDLFSPLNHMSPPVMTLCNSAQIVQQMKHNYWCWWHWLSLWNSLCWLWQKQRDFAVLPANPRNAILAFRCISCEINVWIVLQVCGSNVNNLSAPDTFQSWHSLSRTWTAAVHSGPADLSLWPDTISTSDSWTLRSAG